MNATLKFLGTTDEHTTCDCCGKTGLKSTVAIQKDAEDLFYGSTCAARALSMSVKAVKEETKKADKAKDDAKNAQEQAKHAAHMAAWTAFVTKTSGHTDLFLGIQAMGGIVKAREAFRTA